MLRREKQGDDIDMYIAKMAWPKQELMTIPSSPHSIWISLCKLERWRKWKTKNSPPFQQQNYNYSFTLATFKTTMPSEKRYFE